MDAFLSGLHPAQSINQSPRKVYGHVRVILLDLQHIRCLEKLEHVLPNGGLMVILVRFHDDIPWYNLQSVKKSTLIRQIQIQATVIHLFLMRNLP